MPARLIVLSGASSSAKTSVAAALQAQLSTRQRPVLHVEADRLLPRLPGDFGEGFNPHLLDALCGATTAFAAAGFDVIADGILPYREPEALSRALEQLRRFPVTLVGLRCAPEVLTEGARERLDRDPGFAATQESDIHLGMRYDIDVDTSVDSVETIADSIAKQLDW